MSNAHHAHAALLGGLGPPITHQGKTYRCGAHDQAAKKEVERRLVAQAMAAAALAPPECRAEALAAVAAAASGGAYGFYGEISQRAMATPSGAILLASVLFGVGESEAVDLTNARPDEVRALIDLAILEGLSEQQRQAVLAARAQAREASEEARPTQPPAAVP